jgi:hypothetical protein
MEPTFPNGDGNQTNSNIKMQKEKLQGKIQNGWPRVPATSILNFDLQFWSFIFEF